jgi:hypothetical protein
LPPGHGCRFGAANTANIGSEGHLRSELKGIITEREENTWQGKCMAGKCMTPPQ